MRALKEHEDRKDLKAKNPLYPLTVGDLKD